METTFLNDEVLIALTDSGKEKEHGLGWYTTAFGSFVKAKVLGLLNDFYEAYFFR